MRLSQSVKPISYVKANTGKVLEQVNASGPMIITQNGEAAAVLMSVCDYDRLQESLALLKILSLGNKSIEAGKDVPAEMTFARLRQKVREERKLHG